MIMKSICVFCGSSVGAKTEYVAATKHLAATLAQANITLVYGGGRVGLMGQLADAMMSLGGEVIGVIPQFLVAAEIAHQGISKLYIVDSLHERKTKMADLADGFIMLPGATGSLDEFFEIVTWNQLGLHNKPYGILNVNNYYESLLKFLDNVVTEGFLNPMYRNRILVSNSAEELIKKLMADQEPLIAKWKKNLP